MAAVVRMTKSDPTQAERMPACEARRDGKFDEEVPSQPRIGRRPPESISSAAKVTSAKSVEAIPSQTKTVSRRRRLRSRVSRIRRRARMPREGR